MNGAAIGPHIVYYQFMAGAIQMKGQGASMDQLVDRLNQKLSWQLGRIFVNNSGLKGDYDFELNFSVPWSTSFGPMMSNSQPADGTTGAIPESSLFSAVQEQLGLKLKSTKGPIQVLSIEHIEEPSEN